MSTQTCFRSWWLLGLALAQSAVVPLTHAQTAKDGASIAGRITVNSAKPNSLPAVVYLTGLDEPPPKEPASMSQRDKKYVPDVLVITRGQEVQFSNDDKVVHNVFSMSEARQFDLGEGKPGSSAKADFANTGIIDLYCNIHSGMVANILVLPNRRFAYTDSNGNYKIDGIPPGKYQLFAWHRMASPARADVDVKAGAKLDVSLTLNLDKEPVQHLNKAGKPYPKITKPGEPYSY